MVLSAGQKKAETLNLIPPKAKKILPMQDFFVLAGHINN
jgi:hypothetical protein